MGRGGVDATAGGTRSEQSPLVERIDVENANLGTCGGVVQLLSARVTSPEDVLLSEFHHRANFARPGVE